MKKQFIKGILAATLAFTTVLSVPQGSFPGAKSDNTIIAYAACSHNYRHYGTWTSWSVVRYLGPEKYQIEMIGGKRYRCYYRYAQLKRLYCSTCVNCGYQDTDHPLSSETKNAWVLISKKRI